MFIFSDREGIEQYKVLHSWQITRTQRVNWRVVQWWHETGVYRCRNTEYGTLQREVRKEPLTISVAGGSE